MGQTAEAIDKFLTATDALPERVTTKALGESSREALQVYLIKWAAKEPDKFVERLRAAFARVRETVAPKPAVLAADSQPRAPEAPAPAPAKGPAASPPKDPQNPWGLPLGRAESAEADAAPCFRCGTPTTDRRTVRGREDVPACAGCVEAAREAVRAEFTCARCRGVAFDGARWCGPCVEAVRASHPARAELEAEARGLRGHLEYALMGLDVLRDRGLAVRRADVRTALLAWAGEGGWAGDAVSRLRDAIEWAWRARGDADAEIDRLARRLGPSWAPTVEKMKKSSPLWHAIPTLSAALARPPGADVPPPSPAAHVPPAACPCGAPAVFYDSIAGQMQRHLCRPCAEAAGYELAPALPGPGEPDALGFREGALGDDAEREAIAAEGAAQP
ncbi:MAG TPA: hypothetical protein VFS43_21630 [Polyangiaceae bacterium]|nr:hypothetical protein [Polyangiaceae bacterium]